MIKLEKKEDEDDDEVEGDNINNSIDKNDKENEIKKTAQTNKLC